MCPGILLLCFFFFFFKEFSKSKPPPYGGYSSRPNSSKNNPLVEPKLTSCPPTFRNSNTKMVSQEQYTEVLMLLIFMSFQSKSVKLHCTDLSVQGRDLFTAGQESVKACVALGDQFGKNFRTTMDCTEAQSKLERQMFTSTDSEPQKLSSILGFTKLRRKYRKPCTEANTTRQKDSGKNNNGNKKTVDKFLEDVESSLCESSYAPLQLCEKSKAATKRSLPANLLDQIVEIHVGQAAVTDGSVVSSQHSESDVSNFISHQYTHGSIHPKKKNVKPISQLNANCNKVDVKARREALMHHLLMNEVLLCCSC